LEKLNSELIQEVDNATKKINEMEKV